MKNLFVLLTLALLVFPACETSEPVVDEGGSGGLIETSDDPFDIGEMTGKPVLYLYPREATEVTLELDYEGRITTEYPQSTNGTWKVLADPDGTLTMNGRTYPYLFWEGISSLTQSFEFSEGFSVNRTNAISFLEEKLTLLGLNEKEQTDFITYWLPKMQENEWTTVRFLYEEYEELAEWTIAPKPETFLRVFVIMEGSDQEVNLPQQILVPAVRQGFTVVEWGGTYFLNQ